MVGDYRLDVVTVIVCVSMFDSRVPTSVLFATFLWVVSTIHVVIFILGVVHARFSLSLCLFDAA